MSLHYPIFSKSQPCSLLQKEYLAQKEVGHIASKTEGTISISFPATKVYINALTPLTA